MTECMTMGCPLPKALPAHRCEWCLMGKMPADDQIALALARRSNADSAAPRTRPAATWPPGLRWCGGCYSWVGLAYCGSQARCGGCRLADRRGANWNLTDAQQDQLLKMADSRCMICGKHSNASSLAVDHDHYSQDVRGLLCGKGGASCNEVIGDWHDDPMRFLRTAVYLINSPARKVGIGPPPLTDRETAQKVFDMLRTIFEG